jgi:hypothetical protein
LRQSRNTDERDIGTAARERQRCCATDAGRGAVMTAMFTPEVLQEPRPPTSRSDPTLSIRAMFQASAQRSQSL